MSTKSEPSEKDEKRESARARLASTGRNDPCPCGSGKKYKKCHLAEDEAANAVPPRAPDADDLLAEGWRLFEQRRPAAAEKQFRAALALRPDWADAMVAIGLARLRAGDQEGARKELNEVLRVSEKLADDLKASGVKDAFSRKEAQAYLRASHALGCMAFDQERYSEAVADLERVYSVDQGPVGTEARLIAATAQLKLKQPAEAIAILKVPAEGENGSGRVLMSLGLAQFAAGDREAAKASLLKALDANRHFATELFRPGAGLPNNLGTAAAGSREEAQGYAQTFGSSWDEAAKTFLKEVVSERTKRPREANLATAS